VGSLLHVASHVAFNGLPLICPSVLLNESLQLAGGSYLLMAWLYWLAAGESLASYSFFSPAKYYLFSDVIPYWYNVLFCVSLTDDTFSICLIFYYSIILHSLKYIDNLTVTVAVF